MARAKGLYFGSGPVTFAGSSDSQASNATSSGLRASVRAHCTSAQAAELCALGLQLRGDGGEHAPQINHVCDISPWQRLGLTK